jgi:hypothetical protein
MSELLRSFLDHITVTSPSLESGADFVRQVLGVEPQLGGEHPRMGTHNLLLRLGESMFLEVISPNPKVDPPGRPRWFGLDDLRADTPPRLSTWVARTTDILAAAAACSEPLGNIEPMSRGKLDWLITIPADGSIPADGVGPVLIEWSADDHPAATLHDHGLSLLELKIYHPDPDRIFRMISSINLSARISVSESLPGIAPHLVALIDTPNGVCRL